MNELNMIRVLLEEPPPSAEVLAEGRRRIAGGSDRSRSVRAGRLPARRVLLAAGVAAGLAAVAVSAGMASLGGPDGPAPAHTRAQLTAALMLRQAASGAARQAPASGRVFFAESEDVELSGGAYSVESGGVVKRHVLPLHWSPPALRKFWLSRHGGGLLEGPGSKPVRVHGGIPVSSRIREPDGGFELMGADYLSWGQISRLPTAQGPLRAFVVDLARKSGDKPLAAAEFQAICELLYESPAPPAVRAALYDLAATLPGARLIRRTHDVLGRVATEVYLPGGGFGQALLFSPATGAVLGQAGLSESGPRCPPLWASAVLATGYVSSLGQLPPGAPRRAKPTSFRHSVPGCRLPGQATR